MQVFKSVFENVRERGCPSGLKGTSSHFLAEGRGNSAAVMRKMDSSNSLLCRSAKGGRGAYEVDRIGSESVAGERHFLINCYYVRFRKGGRQKIAY